MANITLKQICKRYTQTGKLVVDHVDLEIHDHEFLVLVGPSGCGKSTTLRMIAGLEEITGGELYIGDKLVNKLPPKDRNISMVFQNYALYPHLSVEQNLGFGLKLQVSDKAELKKQVTKMAEVLELTALLHRKPGALSGGQRQRVAMGRAMIRETDVLLMDEPLSNLDAKLRVQMRAEILALHKKIPRTIVYVTHDQVEAMTMGDRIAVFHEGVIQQVDSPERIFDTPANLFVAGFIGSPPMNLIDCDIQSEEGVLFARNSAFRIRLPERMQTETLRQQCGRPSVLGIRPEGITPVFQGGDLAATAEIVQFLGTEELLSLQTACGPVLVKSDSISDVKPGDRAALILDRAALHIFDRDSQKNLSR